MGSSRGEVGYYGETAGVSVGLIDERRPLCEVSNLWTAFFLERKEFSSSGGITSAA